MQKSSPHPAPNCPQHPPQARALARPPWGVALLLLTALAVAVAAAPAPAQTLARPGLAGSGINTDPWWMHSVFYTIAAPPADPADHSPAGQSATPDFKAITANLEALRALGADALIVPTPRLPIQPQKPAAAAGAPTPAAIAPTPDTRLDDFDELIHQASRRGMRVLLTLTASDVASDLPTVAQFWISRGVAGFHLVTPPETSPQDVQAIVQGLRKVTNAAVGQRIVISDFAPGWSGYDPATARFIVRPDTPGAHPRTTRIADPTAPQMLMDSRLGRLALPGAADFRALLALTGDRSLAQPNLLLDYHPLSPPPGTPNPYPALEKAIAAMVLSTNPAAVIDADQVMGLAPDPPAPDAHSPAASPAPISLADWYRQLSALHHGNPALRYGSFTLLDFDQQNALVWVRRVASTSTSNAPPVVVACNLSANPVTLSLGTAIRGLNLRGSFLRTMLRTDEVMGPQDLDAVILPPFGVYIGELER